MTGRCGFLLSISGRNVQGFSETIHVRRGVHSNITNFQARICGGSSVSIYLGCLKLEMGNKKYSNFFAVFGLNSGFSARKK